MTPSMMRAFAVAELGRPESFALCELPIPVPAAGEVRLRLEATGISYVDGLIVAGRYQLRPAMPYVPGAELVGIVDRLGPDVEGIPLGARVASWQLARGGGAAQFAIAPAEQLVMLPDGLSSTAAAAMLLDFLTAHYALFDRGGLCPGETVLVLGAAGGVGAAGAGARPWRVVSASDIRLGVAGRYG